MILGTAVHTRLAAYGQEQIHASPLLQNTVVCRATWSRRHPLSRPSVQQHFLPELLLVQFGQAASLASLGGQFLQSSMKKEATSWTGQLEPCFSPRAVECCLDLDLAKRGARALIGLRLANHEGRTIIWSYTCVFNYSGCLCAAVGGGSDGESAVYC